MKRENLTEVFPFFVRIFAFTVGHVPHRGCGDVSGSLDFRLERDFDAAVQRAAFVRVVRSYGDRSAVADV